MKSFGYQLPSCEVVEIPYYFSHYQFEDIIGEGAHAVIIRAKDVRNGKLVACKLNYRKFLSDEGILTMFEKELRINMRLKHPYIVPIHDVIYKEDSIITVMDFYKYGDLLNVLAMTNLNEIEVLEIVKKVLEALCYLHQRGIAHRDIKPENIVLDDERNPVLIDFGYCTEQKSGLSSTLCGTLSYMAPEEIIGQDYDAMKADIWSLGVTIFVITTRNFPFKSQHPRAMLREIQNVDNILRESVSSKLYILLSQMLVIDPTKRKTAEELYELFKVKQNPLSIARASTKPNKLNVKSHLIQARDVKIIKPRAISRSTVFSSNKSHGI